MSSTESACALAPVATTSMTATINLCMDPPLGGGRTDSESLPSSKHRANGRRSQSFAHHDLRYAPRTDPRSRRGIAGTVACGVAPPARVAFLLSPEADGYTGRAVGARPAFLPRIDRRHA